MEASDKFNFQDLEVADQYPLIISQPHTRQGLDYTQQLRIDVFLFPITTFQMTDGATAYRTSSIENLGRILRLGCVVVVIFTSVDSDLYLLF